MIKPTKNSFICLPSDRGRDFIMLKLSNNLNYKIVPIPIQAYAITKKGIPYPFGFIGVSANTHPTISNNIISLRVINKFYSTKAISIG
jgi:hypothetical protein